MGGDVIKPLSGPTPMTDAVLARSHGGLYNERQMAERADIYSLASNLERIAAEAMRALEEIVDTHSMYCENHVGVSEHSYGLAGTASAALSRIKAAGWEDSARLDGKEE